MTKGPLDGYRVIELGQGVPSPFATLQLGDGGADVIKVENKSGDVAREMPPFWVNGKSAVFVSINRNKRSLAIDLTSAEGREVLASLISTADVLVEDVDLTREIGLDVFPLAQKQPQLVHCRISGYGPKGPLSELPGSELTAQLASEAVLSLGSLRDPPIRLGTDVASCYAGIYAAQGILSALWRRHQDGHGQQVDVSLFGCMLMMRATLWAALTNPDDWFGFHNDSYVKPPDYGYQAKDGTIMLVVGRMSDEQWASLFDELGLEDLSDEEKHLLRTQGSVNSRLAHITKPIWERALVNFNVDELLEIFPRNGGNAYRINNYEEMLSHPQTQHLGIVEEVETPDGPVRVLRPPWQFSEDPVSVRLAPPELGQHTNEILAEIGYSTDSVEELRRAGILV